MLLVMEETDNTHQRFWW